MNRRYTPAAELLLGLRMNDRVPREDQTRQRDEVEEILRRFARRPGVVLADEVGMGKTFVALAVAFSVAERSSRGPVIVMVPANLVDKWEQDLRTFFELYVPNRQPVRKDGAEKHDLRNLASFIYGVARDSTELLKLMDGGPRDRCHLIFLTHGAMGRRQTDKWVRLALIAEALRRHGRGGARRLIKVRGEIHHFLAELISALGEERAHNLREDVWQDLLKSQPRKWKEIYNRSARDRMRLADDPVPRSVSKALRKVKLKALADALAKMPIRAVGGQSRVTDRLRTVRAAMRIVDEDLWKKLLAETEWRSPLLVLDEAHHLKNPATLLARQLQSPDSERDLRTGDGAMSRSFDRMLFLTATPFQLGHGELVRVLERFGDVRWDRTELGDRVKYALRMKDLGLHLTESQRAAIALQRAWSRLQPEDCATDVETWWKGVLNARGESLNNRQRAVVDAYRGARSHRENAEQALRCWIIRHNKDARSADGTVLRRERRDGMAIHGQNGSVGLPIPPGQLLPFFLAARSAVKPGQDLLGEALCSSYEAFRYTRRQNDPATDEGDDVNGVGGRTAEPGVAGDGGADIEDLAGSDWYLGEFDRALAGFAGSKHPKIDVTVQTVVDLWETGEKVLVFAFYRLTCSALRIHISHEIDRRITNVAERALQEAGQEHGARAIGRHLARIQKRFFDDKSSPGRRAVDRALGAIIEAHEKELDSVPVSEGQRIQLTDVMRRFLRARTTVARCFPLAELDRMAPKTAVARALDFTDGSNATWRQKFDQFIRFLVHDCSAEERKRYLAAAGSTQTGGIRVRGDKGHTGALSGKGALANIQVATGKTRRDARTRLMHAFNTPFFPDILVCSEVMGEGIDLQRFCRHVVHHDLAWNPSTIEQRTGRVDRLGRKSEGREPIVVYLPYLAGAADERQYRVMSDRERWFRVVMGQDEVARLIRPDSEDGVAPPEALCAGLGFRLGLGDGKGPTCATSLSAKVD